MTQPEQQELCPELLGINAFDHFFYPTGRTKVMFDVTPLEVNGVTQEAICYTGELINE